MHGFWVMLVNAIKAQRGTSNLPLVALLALFAFLACGPFSDTASEFVEPVLKHLRRLIR
jgi:hypothetical protein